MFAGTVAQTLGPEALMQFVNPDEAIKRLAAAKVLAFLTRQVYGSDATRTNGCTRAATGDGTS